MWFCICISEYIFTFCVMCVSLFLSQGGQLVGLMPVLAACHLIYICSILLHYTAIHVVANRVLSLTWSKSVRNLSEIEQSSAELLIILWIFAHLMSRRELDLWPLDRELWQHLGCHAFKLCTESERNWIIHGWVSYRRLSAFSRAILGGGSELTELSQGCLNPTSPNFART